ncbi:hypothetical protein KKG58_04820 [Patescibacteria group bacterium]|nr:hypothetical protein [Patescibacteria group bacterium]
MITFIIFVVWVFNLKTILDEEEIENNLQNIFKQAYSEIKNSLKDMTEGIKTLKDEDLPKLLNDEEVLRLKQKVLEYEKEY